MRTLKLTLAYDGTRFVGWQRQAEGESIQGLLEEALAKFEGAPVTVHGAGRTDAGVHAHGQVASAHVTFTHAPATLGRALNAILPDDIRVLDVAEAPPDFHARFSARSKTYRYQLRTGEVGDPFTRAFEWQLSERLDVDRYACGRGIAGGHARLRGVSERRDRCDQQHPHDLSIRDPRTRRSTPLLVDSGAFSSGATRRVRDPCLCMKSPLTASFGIWSARSSARSWRSAVDGGRWHR